MVGALLVGACGGASQDETAEPSVALDGSESDEPTEPNNSNVPSSDSTTDEPEDISGDSNSEWCQRARTIEASEEQSPLDLDVFRLGADIESMLRTNLETYEQMVAAAPPEIETEIELFLSLNETMVAIGEDAGWDLQSMISDPRLESIFDNPQLEVAADKIDQYTTEVCGVDFGIDTAAPMASPETGVDFGDDGLASIFLEFTFIPREMVSDEQVDCINDELAKVFPEGLEATAPPNIQDFEVFNEIVETCELRPS